MEFHLDKVVKIMVWGDYVTCKLEYLETPKPILQFNEMPWTIQSANLDITYLKTYIESELTRLLKVYIVNQVSYYSKRLKLAPKKIKFESSLRNWGTCNSDKIITFNVKLIHLSKDYVDYVIVHELAHLKHLNHDRSFWRLVGSIIPDYKRFAAM